MNTGLKAVCVFAVALLATSDARAQDQAAPFLVVDFMKSTSPDYTDIEADIWKPLHQERVASGDLVDWVLWGVRYGDRTTYDYTTVNVYPNVASTQGSYDDLAELFARVHPGVDMDKAMAKTSASRKSVRSELWRGVLFEGEQKPYRYASIAYMKVPPGGGSDYIEMERKWHAPLRRAAIEKGCQGAWGIYSLWSPSGTHQLYNYAAVNFTDDWENDCSYDAIMREVHPDADISKIYEKTSAAREMVHGVQWERIDGTTGN